MKLVLEVNPKQVADQSRFASGIMVTPAAIGDKDYWTLRVKVSKDQAIIGFPKFTTIGIGFFVEKDDWNTNLPYVAGTEEIYKHIMCNKGDAKITKAQCLKAIRMIQDAAPAALGKGQ